MSIEKRKLATVTIELHHDTGNGGIPSIGRITDWFTLAIAEHQRESYNGALAYGEYIVTKVEIFP